MGFFPEGAFDDHAARGHLLAAVTEDSELVGYSAFRVTKGRAMIAHLCVADAHRGKGVAKSLFEGVKAYALERDLRGVGLHCRRDFPAYAMWPKLGFAAIGSKPGRGTDGVELTFWWHDLHAKDLFSPFEDADDRMRVVMDCNVFRDLHDVSEVRNQEAGFLRADWLSGQIELCIVKELFNELDRLVLPLPRAPLRRDAHRYRCLDNDESHTESIFAGLVELFEHPKPTPQQASDMRHVAMAAAAGAEVFLTRDGELLGRAAEIEARYGLQVMRPVELISQLDETEHAARYQPARFASTDIQKARPRSEDLADLARCLHMPSQRESRSQFEARLRVSLCDVGNTVVAARVDGAPLFLVVQRHEGNRCIVPVLRCVRSALAATALRHAILQIIADAAKLGDRTIVVQESLLSEEVQSILHELGFRIGTSGWEKVTLRFIGDIPALETALKTIGTAPAHLGSAPEEIEAQYWPAKTIGNGVQTWAVPIQAGWATELFETKFADGLLLPPQRDLILSRENVYYSAATQSGMAGATGRLLWYVSKDQDQPGSQAIRACSRLLEVRRGPAKTLFNEFRRLGVFQWRDVYGLAKKDSAKEILAIRFSDTELFDVPFPGPEAKALGIRNNFTSPVQVAESAFAEIYQRGMRLPARS